MRSSFIATTIGGLLMMMAVAVVGWIFGVAFRAADEVMLAFLAMLFLEVQEVKGQQSNL